MANLGMRFNATEHDTDSQGSYEELPDGIYKMEIEASDVGPNSKNNGTILKITSRVIEPDDFTDRKFFSNFNLEHQNPQAQEIGQRQFAQLCRSIGMSEDIEDSEDLHFREYTVKLGLGKPSKEKDENGDPRYPARPEVKRFYYPDEGNVPEPEVGQPAANDNKPAARSASRPAADKKADKPAASNAGKKRPWG